ncbi:MAG: MarR family transcriptional regulator [Deltaproteobacteria bacterium]|nr:MarR family transcriptional regulator [Deltaproteobacteria bacterium]
MPARPRAPRRLRKVHVRPDLRAIVDECIVLSDRLRWIAAQMHGDDGRLATRRGILRGLARFGAQTVPDLARARSVTRQSLQPVVSALVAEGLVERLANPRHARSPLFRATPRAVALVRAMDHNDDRVLAAVGRGLAPREIAIAARVLRDVRERFEATFRWKVALRTGEPRP